MKWNKDKEIKLLIFANAILLILVVLLYTKYWHGKHRDNVFTELLNTNNISEGSFAPEKYGVTTDTLVVDSLGMKGDINAMDIVMCIDATGSMAGILNTVKGQALNFYSDIKQSCAELGKNVMGMRIKVIAFRDLSNNEAKAIEDTPFYNIPKEKNEFRSFVNGLHPIGGGDNAESALEAIALAIKSEWSRGKGRKRHVIILWTDAPTHPIGKVSCFGTSSFPHDFNGLTELWNGDNISQTGKCLIVFAPNDDSWNAIKNGWNNSFFMTTKSDCGLSEIDYKQIIKAIAESV